ncbi:MAG: hypothetical protein CMJ58_02275 [Planctomycetaceae bacterium]|nr:hypothetical protein [Planctomycetaceae bacterium]
MSKRASTVGILGLNVLVLLLILAATSFNWSRAQEPAKEAEEGEPTPPAGQTYMGAKQCASCHFEQFMKWKATKHATTFNLLPEKYQTDAKCLQCHTTGFGEPTGFKSMAETPDLAGNTCETCHGPGSKHGEIAKQFADQTLTPEQEKAVRDSIWKITPGNSCVKCHMVQGHHESATPPELRKSE